MASSIKEKLYRWSYRLLWVLLMANLLAVMAFVEKAQRSQRCLQVVMTINHDSDLFFTDAEQIESQLCHFLRVPHLQGSPLYKLEPGRLEYILNHSDFIRKAEVWKDIDGTLHIDIQQKRPILRVKTRNEDYYMDELGEKMPLNARFTARVPVATGNVFERYRYGRKMQTYVGNMLKVLALTIDTNAFWSAQIEQIDVDQHSEFVLIPKLGNQRLLVGDTSNLAQKLDNLLLFYRQGMPRAGWGAYTTINAKFTNQIICTK